MLVISIRGLSGTIIFKLGFLEVTGGERSIEIRLETFTISNSAQPQTLELIKILVVVC